MTMFAINSSKLCTFIFAHVQFDIFHLRYDRSSVWSIIDQIFFRYFEIVNMMYDFDYCEKFVIEILMYLSCEKLVNRYVDVEWLNVLKVRFSDSIARKLDVAKQLKSLSSNQIRYFTKIEYCFATKRYTITRSCFWRQR